MKNAKLILTIVSLLISIVYSVEAQRRTSTTFIEGDIMLTSKKYYNTEIKLARLHRQNAFYAGVLIPVYKYGKTKDSHNALSESKEDIKRSVYRSGKTYWGINAGYLFFPAVNKRKGEMTFNADVVIMGNKHCQATLGYKYFVYFGKGNKLYVSKGLSLGLSGDGLFMDNVRPAVSLKVGIGFTQ